MTRSRLIVLLGFIVACAAPFIGAGVASAACEPAGMAVDVQVDADACGDVAAVSVTGNAETQCAPLPNNSGCVAVSGTGDASNTSSNFNCAAFVGASAGCIAVSGTGDASNTAGGNCGYAGVGVFVGCIAISGTGNASNSVSGVCGSETTAAIGGGCIAVSGDGDASNSAGSSGGKMCGDASVASIAIGCMAASGTGNASNTIGAGTKCGTGSLAGVGMGCMAVSGAGDASNSSSGPCGISSLATGVGCVAVSGQGSASNQAADCDHGDEITIPEQTVELPEGNGEITTEEIPTDVDSPAVGCRQIEGPSLGSQLFRGLRIFKSALYVTTGLWTLLI